MALPDIIEIKPLRRAVRSEVVVPGSKSITNRALVLAALASGTTTLKHALWSEDTQVMVHALSTLGIKINVLPEPEEYSNRTIIVNGCGGELPVTGTKKPIDLYVGNAGTAARFLPALFWRGRESFRLSGTPRMHERPQAGLF
ncbi:MAG: 3-phosphoshikimate 1-carboxyvinyltransferase, partial [Verrucomicrobiae bacterium]|nr:3-phosphoshikimate 1-carboxyvinyltransferase [Verrucomicrobiae bacterium]